MGTERVNELFFKACEDGELDDVQRLLHAGAHLNARIGGTTALHACTIRRHVGVAKLLLSQGAHVNETDTNGMTPLHHVAQRGNCQLAALLLSHGADLDARCSNGSTALHQAASSIAKGKLELLQLLVTEGSATCLEVPDNFGCADQTGAISPSASAQPSCCSRMALDLVDDRSVVDKVAVLSDTLRCLPLVCAARILLRRHTSARLVRALHRDGVAAALLQTLAAAASRQTG